MPKGKTLFSYFSPKPSPKSTPDGASEVLTPKKSPNDKSPQSIKSTPINKNGSFSASGASPSLTSGAKIAIGSSWQVGDLVWAKLEGYPWWPGLVTLHPTTSSHIMKGKRSMIHVQFFDDPPSRAWVKDMLIEEFSGSDTKEFKKGGRYWTPDIKCHEGALEADKAMRVTAVDERIEKFHKMLPSTEESEDDEEEMDYQDESKENIENEVIFKTPSKSPRAKGRLPSRQATKRRRIIVEDGASDDSEEFKPPKKGADGSDDSGTSGVSEQSSSSASESEESGDASGLDSPLKEPSKKRKRPEAKQNKPEKTTGPRIKRRADSGSDSEPEAPKIIRPSPWEKAVVAEEKPAPLLTSPIVSTKTKSRLSTFSAPETSSTPSVETDRTFTYINFDILKPDKIKDAKMRGKEDPDYDCRTIHLPASFLEKQTPAMRQWWELKAKHFDTLLFFKMGKFYELFHMDATVAVKELGVIYMKGDHAHCGFPEIAYGRYADTLLKKGYKVARIEQTETPDMCAERCKKLLKATKFDKVVRREVCRVSTKGTRVYSFIDGDTTESQAAFLLAIAEKEPIEGAGVGSTFGVCFVDTSIGEFHIGQFDDDRHCSRLRTLISHYVPVEVLHEKGKISDKTKTLLNNNLVGALREALHSGSEFWDSSKVLKVLSESDYFTDENDKDAGQQWPQVLQEMKADSDPLGHTAADNYDLALRSLGAITWYLRGSCLDQELLSLRKFSQYHPIDQDNRQRARDQAVPTVFTARQHMVLDGVTLANLDLVENSSTGGPEGSLLQRLDSCATPFGQRLLKQWLVSPLCQPASINDRLDAVEDLIDAQDVVSESRELLKKLPDLERLLSKIHTLGSATRNQNHPDGRAVFFEDLTYSKRKIEDLLSALNGFQTASEIITKCESIAKKFKSKLLRQTTLIGDDGRFPDLKEQLDYFEHAFDRQKAKTHGGITPNKGVDLEYDTALSDIKRIKKELDNYLEEQRDCLKCRSVSYFGTAKNRFQLEVPDSASKRVPDSYEVTSQKKGFRRYWTDEIKSMLAETMDAEDRRDAALKDCLRRIFNAFDKSHKQWLTAVQCLAMLDVLISLSEFSRCGDGVMCRPEIVSLDADTKPMLEIRSGRHPCIAQTFSGGDFIPNDTVIGTKDTQDDGESIADSQVVLVTGPNMGGKSTLMRQVGVIITLAQLGCYTPAESCRLTPVDRIFTRLGASDRIMAGESTFFVELSETSAILQHATKHSLVLLDELGRGTATYDGTAIACGVVQELSQHIGCRTLFSTHYHSLVEEFSHDPNIRLGHMACMVENEDADDPSQETITFLYKFIGGACPKSYGFNAARLADIPEEIIKVATKKAKDFENTTNRIDWFRALHRAEEASIEQIRTVQQLIAVN